MTKAKKNIILFGGRTHENRGDLAMHRGLLDWLAAERLDLHPVFLASNPETTAARFGVESRFSPDAALAQPWTRDTPRSWGQRLASFARGLRFARRPPEPFATDLRHAAAAFIPGSGSINSLWWHDWLHVKTWQALAARRAGVPVFATSQGVGPAFSHPLDRLAARWLFRSCRLAGVRDDEASAAILRHVGVPEEKIVHTGDDALLVDPNPAATSPLLPGLGGEQPLIALNLRDSSGYGRRYPKPHFDFWEQLATGLASLPCRPAFLFLPISYDPHDDDRKPARELRDRLLAHGVDARRMYLPEEPLETPTLRALASRATLGIGISYHFLLFCLAGGAPVFGVWQNPYYRAKVDGLLRLHDLAAHSLNPSETDPAELVRRAATMLTKNSRSHQHLAGLLPGLRDRESRARRQLLNLLPNP